MRERYDLVDVPPKQNQISVNNVYLTPSKYEFLKEVPNKLAKKYDFAKDFSMTYRIDEFVFNDFASRTENFNYAASHILKELSQWKVSRSLRNVEDFSLENTVTASLLALFHIAVSEKFNKDNISIFHNRYDTIVTDSYAKALTGYEDNRIALSYFQKQEKRSKFYEGKVIEVSNNRVLLSTPYGYRTFSFQNIEKISLQSYHRPILRLWPPFATLKIESVFHKKANKYKWLVTMSGEPGE